MALHDYDKDMTAVFAEAPALNTDADTAIVSEIIDCANCQGVTFVGVFGTLSDAGCTYAVTMEQGDNSALSDTAAAETVGSDITRTLPSGTQADDNETFQIGYIGSKRYCRLTLTPTGNASGNIPFALVAIKNGQRYFS